MSLAIPSWAFGEIETPEVEREIEHSRSQKQEGKLQTPEGKSYSCKEAPELKEKVEMCEQRLTEKSPMKEQGQKRPLSSRSFIPAKGEARTQTAQRTAQASRMLQQSRPLPKPLHLAASKGGEAKTKAPSLVQNRTTYKPTDRTQTTREKGQIKEGERTTQKELAHPLQQFSPLHHDYIERERQHREREWTHEEEGTVSGAIFASRVFKPQASSKKIEASYSKPTFDRPILQRPKLGIFALYYILTKVGLISDAQSHYETKQNIHLNEEQTQKAHKERLEELKKVIKDEKSAKRWAVATQVFSWFTSFMGIMAGIALILTGVGVVAGVLLLTAGIIQITNQIMQLTGAWQKIAQSLPGDDPQKKQATILWMQIGITVLCLILSVAGGVFGGFTAIKDAMQTSSLVTGGVIMMGYGTTNIGEGISNYMHRNRLAEVRKHQIKLAQLKHARQDLEEKVRSSIDRMEQLFEELSRALEFEVELFRADQKVNRA
ncbi:MAG: hypothetical protein H7A36_06880 [Chlamydiales bacterium]|nr:hypothetical protein [Chlamydiales bacterium]